MRKFLFVIFTLFVCVSAAGAQESTKRKSVVIVDVFTVKSAATSTYRQVAVGIRDKVIAALNKTERIDVIDVTTEAFFKQRAQNATSEEALMSALEGSDVRESASKEFEAKFAIMGNVSHLGASRGTLDDGTVYYSGEVNVSIKVINLEDGTIVHSKNFNYAGLTGMTGKTEVASINNTANLLVAAVPKFVDKAFPIVCHVLEIINEKKGSATDVYVDIGSAAGVKEKDKFNVFQIKTVAGNLIKEEIGDMVVEAVNSEEVSTCKVSKSCGEAIYKSISDPENYNIVIISRPKSGFGAAMGGIGKSLAN